MVKNSYIFLHENLYYLNLSISGRLLETIPVKTNGNKVREQLDLTNYASGIYFLKVEVGGEILIEKLIKLD
ncbi:MAG: T9SS type A sorting domain-containing protein [Bacteroidota bacterium]